MKAGIDIHEPDSLVRRMTNSSYVEEVYHEELESGDIVIGGIGFERKTISDYVGSMQDKRIETQTRKMANVFEDCYILIDGDLSETDELTHTNMRGSSIRGSMASITARDNGVNAVIPCTNKKYLADMAIRISRKHTTEDTGIYVPPNPAEGMDVPVEIRMYCCIDGIGPKTAKQLYNEYGSLREIVARGKDELMEMNGIGEVQATKIMQTIEMNVLL